MVRLTRDKGSMPAHGLKNKLGNYLEDLTNVIYVLSLYKVNTYNYL